jgi:2-methylcitrate dehydratase PrpD
MAEVTRELARFALRPFDPIPEPALRMGKQMILNALGLAIGAAHEPPVEIECAMVRSMQTPPEATVLGRGMRVAATWAAFLNGTGIHLEDFDDSHYKSKMKPSGPIPAAALAMAEYLGACGRELIEAVVVGSEVAIRILCGYEGTLIPSWHPTGAIGAIGAAVAAGRLARVDEVQMLHALGIAATETAGLMMAAGHMTKPLHVGKAAFQGIEAVQMAQLGFTSSPTAIEGRHGLGALTGGAFHVAACLDGLGEKWEVADNALKPYACGVVDHPIVDAAIELRRHFKSADEIDRIDIVTHPMALKVLGNREPADGLQSKWSPQHCAAVGFIDGHAGPRQFSDEHVVAQHVVALRRRIHITTTPEVRFGAAVLTAYGTDGRILRLENDSERVMTQRELERKVKLLAGDRIEPLLRVMDRLETLDRIDELIAAVPTAMRAESPAP